MAAKAASFCSPMIPHRCALPLASARCTWMMATSGFNAGTAIRSWPPYGSAIRLMLGLACSRSVAAVCFIGRNGKPGRTRLQAGDHAEVRILLPLDLAPLDRRPNQAQRSDPGIAHVGEDHLPGTACSHHLVVDQIRRGAGQDQIPPSLADDLVPRGERDQVCESGGVQQVAVLDEC